MSKKKRRKMKLKMMKAVTRMLVNIILLMIVMRVQLKAIFQSTKFINLHAL